MNADDRELDSEIERRIQAAVELRMAQWQSQVATAMQTSIQQSIAELDKVQAQLESERSRLAEEMQRTRNEREELRQQANQLLQAALDENYRAWKQETKAEVLSWLAHSHLRSGEAVSSICHWLDVAEDFVIAIEQQLKFDQMERARLRSADRISLPHHPRLTYESSGRGGTIHFENDHTKFGLWWEFGGRDAVALVGIPNLEQWESSTGLPLTERENTIRFIAEQLIEDQTISGGTFRITADFLTIYVS